MQSKSDESILDELMMICQKESLDFELHLDSKLYSLDSVKIIKSPTPVTRPTTRGGVYFSDTFAYKLIATLGDSSIIPLLSKTMLGPNTDFEEIKIDTNVNFDKTKKSISIFTNLTNSMHNSNKIELHLLIVKAELG